MGLIHAEIELINGHDEEFVRRGFMDKNEIKRITVMAIVDTGAYMMAINENIQEYLKLPVVDKKPAMMANGQRISCDIVVPLELRFKNRQTTCRAMVLPGDSEVLLGSIPLEDMDVMIHPFRQELIVNPDHPDYAVTKMVGLRPC